MVAGTGFALFFAVLFCHALFTQKIMSLGKTITGVVFFAVIGAILGGILGAMTEEGEAEARKRDRIHQDIKNELDSILHKANSDNKKRDDDFDDEYGDDDE